MARLFRYALQALVYAAIAVLLGWFSNMPTYRHFPADKALIKLSLVHAGAPRAECRQLTAAELAKLAPNMRRQQTCPRERVALWLEMRLDEAPLVAASLPPTGFAKDGPSRIYRRLAVAPGRHRLVLRLRDSAREQGYDYEFDGPIELVPGQSLAIGFQAESGGFLLM
jgi:hypothetical protein